jgi:biotin operon repressor
MIEVAGRKLMKELGKSEVRIETHICAKQIVGFFA